MYTPKRQSVSRDKTRTPHGYSSPYTEERLTKRFCPKSSLQVIEQGDSHQLVRLNSGLPVNVSEELSRSNLDHLSTSIQPSGWCYMISNRKAFLWRLSSTSLTRKATTSLEFHLCSTELHHKSSLFCIMENNSPDALPMTACKTSASHVSPEGIVRYWSDINKPSVFVESSMDLGGKSCHAMFYVKPHGCVVVTTTNDLYILSFTVGSINCQLLSVPTGMLSNIGRRVSSFWTQPSETSNKYPPNICDGTLDYDGFDRYFYVVVDSQLQKWELTGDQVCSAKIVYRTNLMNCLKLYNGDSSVSFVDITDFQVVDMKNTGSGLVLLMKVLLGNSLHFFLGTFRLHVDDPNSNSFGQIVDVTEHLTHADQMKMVLPTGSYNAFISTKQVVIAVPLSKTNRKPLKVEFDETNQGLIGTGSFGAESVYLCKRNGLISLKVQSYGITPEIAERTTKIQSSATTQKKEEIHTPYRPDITGDAHSCMRNAFKSYTSSGSTTIPVSKWSQFSPKNIKEAVVDVSKEILNSSPATEPRWSSSLQKDIDSSSQPLLLFNQLKDKENVHNEFIKFLKISNIWTEVLSESLGHKYEVIVHGEKLQCTLALLDLYSNFSQLIDEVILATDISDASDGNLIVKKDTFFSKVTDIGQFFVGLLQLEQERLSDSSVMQKHIECIAAVGEILTTCYIAAWRYRQSSIEQHSLSPDGVIPWTGGNLDIENRRLLTRQIKITFEKAFPRVDSTKVGSMLAQHVVLIADILLDGFDKEIHISKSNDALLEEFHERRRYIIQQLVEFGYIEEAMTLAEKYEDFPMLINLCEKMNDKEKLEQYKVMYKEQGFLDVLYKWYIDNGNWGRLLSMKEASDDDFFHVLNAHPYLGWIHYTGAEKYTQAAKSLKSLAENENIFAERKKMMLVMSSLSALASGDPHTKSHCAEIERELEILEHQNTILHALGKDKSGYPMTPKNLIQVCLDAQHKIMSECFQPVFHLLHYVDDAEERQNLSMQYWCKCIQEDSWEACAMLQYKAVVSKKLFCKALNYCKENTVQTCLIPRLNEMMTSSQELAHRVTTDLSFKQQLQACYELLNLQTYASIS